MRRPARLSGFPGLLFLLVGLPAFAGDDEDLLDDEDEEKALEELKGKDEGGEGDLLDGEDVPVLSGPGVDTDAIYREQVDKLKGEDPEDELQAWERYIAKYFRSRFKDRIEKRMAELEDLLYGEVPENPDGPKVDAKDAEIRIAQPLQLDNLNPRTRLQAGFEWGLPDYINLFADYEHAVLRTLSFHGGVRHRYTGWRLEAGTRYALVKSARTGTVLSLLGDVHLNTIPAYPVLRPQIGFANEFGKLDVQLQVGTELDTRKGAGARLIGGVNLTYQAADTVAVFLETSSYMQSLKSDAGALPYHFHTLNFGMKFFPKVDEKAPQKMEVNAGTSVPVIRSHWGYHFGSIMGQMNYYFED